MQRSLSSLDVETGLGCLGCVLNLLSPPLSDKSLLSLSISIFFLSTYLSAFIFAYEGTKRMHPSRIQRHSANLFRSRHFRNHDELARLQIGVMIVLVMEKDSSWRCHTLIDLSVYEE